MPPLPLPLLLLLLLLLLLEPPGAVFAESPPSDRAPFFSRDPPFLSFFVPDTCPSILFRLYRSVWMQMDATQILFLLLLIKLVPLSLLVPLSFQLYDYTLYDAL